MSWRSKSPYYTRDQYGHSAQEINTYCTRGQYGHTVLEVNTYCDRIQKGNTRGQCDHTAVLLNMDILRKFHTLPTSGTRVLRQHERVKWFIVGYNVLSESAPRGQYMTIYRGVIWYFPLLLLLYLQSEAYSGRLLRNLKQYYNYGNTMPFCLSYWVTAVKQTQHGHDDTSGRTANWGAVATAIEYKKLGSTGNTVRQKPITNLE